MNNGCVITVAIVIAAFNHPDEWSFFFSISLEYCSAFTHLLHHWRSSH